LLHRPPFEILASGWGYFPIRAVVALKRRYAWVSKDAMAGPEGQSLLPLTWMLDFYNDFSYSDIAVGIVEV
jgi:hypothetical protein